VGDAEGLVQVKMTHVRACKEGSGLERSGEERREEKRGEERKWGVERWRGEEGVGWYWLVGVC
jgi:hypothetical protein